MSLAEALSAAGSPVLVIPSKPDIERDAVAAEWESSGGEVLRLDRFWERDEYMVAAGVPVPRDDHAEAIAELALKIQDYMAMNEFDGKRLELRIGIHSGPVVAGIIGTHKFAYDLWGDTVNTASRMESGGIAGKIQVTPTTYELLASNGYAFEPRGTIEVKGKGQMNTWLLVGRT